MHQRRHFRHVRASPDIAGVIRREIAYAADYPWSLPVVVRAAEQGDGGATLHAADELDRLASDRPLVVFAGLHVAMLNTNAMEALGLLEGPDRRGMMKSTATSRARQPAL